MPRIAILNWRAQLLVDAYQNLPGGEALGTDKQVAEPYIDLARQRGCPIPHNFGAVKAGIRNEYQRGSWDAKIFKKDGWCDQRPALFRQLRKGVWGLTEIVREQELRFSRIIDNKSFLTAGEVAVQPTVRDLMPIVDNNLSEQEFYGIEMLPIPGVIEFPSGRLLKLGISEDPLARLAEMQTSNPCPLQLAFRHGAKNIPALEAKALLAASARRAKGEWVLFDTATQTLIGQTIMRHV
jgi:hypothetical protein